DNQQVISFNSAELFQSDAHSALPGYGPDFGQLQPAPAPDGDDIAGIQLKSRLHYLAPIDPDLFFLDQRGGFAAADAQTGAEHCVETQGSHSTCQRALGLLLNPQLVRGNFPY